MESFSLGYEITIYQSSIVHGDSSIEEVLRINEMFVLGEFMIIRCMTIG
jgi:hypothetical protein